MPFESTTAKKRGSVAGGNYKNCRKSRAALEVGQEGREVLRDVDFIPLEGEVYLYYTLRQQAILSRVLRHAKEFDEREDK